ncbi:hypothetical protein [Micromonospora sp. LA-10]|uniref:hypothetical protein n=1 Tax=Micromonospora sp. LA-10 TaxID=3446364 RepID=UPI003F728519
MHFTPSGSRTWLTSRASWSSVVITPCSLPTMQCRSSTKMPKAGAPEAYRQRTGAVRAVERVLTICRRETVRFWRTPGTAGAYPLRTFSPIFFAAAARARALSG